jgi:2-polyprenyl-3-methyl-5-hydroxy-6-metoxy-1,4-benzoquinol methylase
MSRNVSDAQANVTVTRRSPAGLIMLYNWKVRALKVWRINYWWRYYRAWRGHRVGHYGELPNTIRRFAPGRSFVDIGCMWGVNGDYAFAAEEAGATAVTGVDVFGPTPEFEQKKAMRGSRVRFVLGDATEPRTIAEIGEVDVVFCAGVLYHHPSPFDLLTALRQICRSTLILRTSTIPEVDGLPNAAVFFPMLPDGARAQWNLSSLGLLNQVGISSPFEAGAGYSNWFWGLTPSCLRSMLEVAGFRVDEQWGEAFAQTLICTPVAVEFRHRLPGELEAREIAQAISAARIARPA